VNYIYLLLQKQQQQLYNSVVFIYSSKILKRLSNLWWKLIH